MPSFFNGKRFFLTYPQTNHELANELITFLRTKGTLVAFVVGKELHANGDQHLHVCIEYEGLLRGHERLFDFQGRHPNIQSPRNWNACKNYCKKDGNFEEWNLDDGTQPVANRRQSGDRPTEEEFEEKLMESTEEGWMLWCAINGISCQYAQWFWNRTVMDSSTIQTRLPETEQFICPALRQFAFNNDIHRSFIIKGPSGCGKTTWAKLHMPLPSLFVSHIDQLKTFRPGFHKSIIFDDVDFNHWPRHSQIHLLDYDNPRAIHCRYSTANIPANIPKCFTCNKLPVDLTDEAIRRRVRVYNVRPDGIQQQ